ncbi:tetratricopeptide repeat protein [bacterium]|nr:tetratricopeptide repeat protein [candidate division CSSED10-310 bacterium]
MKRYFIFVLFVIAFGVGCSNKHMSRTDKAKLYYDAGIGYINEGNPQSAIENFKLAYELDQKNPQILHAMGLAYLQMGVPETALGWLKQTLKILPDDPEVNNNTASTFIMLKQYQEAIAHSSKAISDPDYRTPAAAYFNRGISYLRLERWEEAEKDFRSAIQHEPMYDMPRVELGRIMIHRNCYADAVQMLTSAIKVNARNAEAYLLRGQALWHQGYVSRAEADFNTILKLNNAGSTLIQQAHDWLERLR